MKPRNGRKAQCRDEVRRRMTFVKTGICVLKGQLKKYLKREWGNGEMLVKVYNTPVIILWDEQILDT